MIYSSIYENAINEAYLGRNKDILSIQNAIHNLRNGCIKKISFIFSI